MIFDFFKKPIGWAVAAVLLFLVLGGAWGALTGKWKAEARLSRNQAEAASKSGSDAVNTVGSQNKAEDATDKITKENSDAIRSAPGADATVAAPVRDVGVASLCRRRSAQRDPKCVQLSAPVGVAGGR